MRARLNHDSKFRRFPKPGLFAFILGLFTVGLAVLRLAGTFPLRWMLGYAALISALAALFNWYDKKQAERGGWRVSEATLHLVEIAGGWPGAYLTQRVIRHKISKTSYQVAFWIIVACYGLVALDYLLAWPILHWVLSILAR